MTNQISFTPSLTVHLCGWLVLKVSVGQSTSLMDLNGFYGALKDSNGGSMSDGDAAPWASWALSRFLM